MVRPECNLNKDRPIRMTEHWVGLLEDITLHRLLILYTLRKAFGAHKDTLAKALSQMEVLI